MSGKTFVEKIFGASAGSIVNATPDIVLTHDNTASIEKTFIKRGGEHPIYPDRLLVVLDHNAPPTNSKLANDYEAIRNFVKRNKVKKFHDVGDGICHQLMSEYALPGLIIVGSDSHTCTAGAFNAFAAGIDRTEAAKLWQAGETWFRVPETIKITLEGKLGDSVSAKDLALWIIGMIGSAGATYKSVEFHGEGIKTLSVSDRMTIANLTAEMGAKNAVFPVDERMTDFLKNKEYKPVWADDDAVYSKAIDINLTDIVPVASCPHHVDNVKAIGEIAGLKLKQALIGTCTNGRIEDLRMAAKVLDGKTIHSDVQLLVIPASKEIYIEAMEEGLISSIMRAGGVVLSSSCGPCLGTGMGIPADGYNVISTANRNFLGRMGNKKANIYLASPETVAVSALKGEITDPRKEKTEDKFPFPKKQSKTVIIEKGDDRYQNLVWNYADVDNLNTDQMFAGSLTYNVNSSEPEKITPYLFKDLDESFAGRVQKDDIIICGENFGCGSSREHPSVGLAHVGIKTIIVKSVSRIFFRSSVNQGLKILVLPEIVNAYRAGDSVEIDVDKGTAKIK